MSEGVGTTPGSRIVDGRQVPEVGTWAIDPSHQSFEFVARHLMARVRGRFPAAQGVAEIAERPEDSTLEIEIDASSIDTKDETRDAHMRSDDFFGVEDHPTISFRSTAVRPGEGENDWKVDGDLTIKGATRPVTVDVEFLGAAIDPWGNKRIGFSGVVPKVDRRDWGLVWNTPLETGGWLLSDSVRLEIEAELVKKG
jgi:polyisoprenoid-binding protein YceI